MNFRLKPYIHTIFGCLAIAGAGITAGAYTLLSQSSAACAADPDTPCDPQYMEALEARAWLEAQREIAQNQNLITKPDSVLEYTCFTKFLNVLGDEASNMFSETRRWGQIPGISDNLKTQDQALFNLVGNAVGSYIDSNFKHTYLGGRNDRSLSNADNTHKFEEPEQLGGNVDGGKYQCNEMAKVWKAAKCMNFFDRSDNQDGFYDFKWYESNDPRKLPDGMNCLAPDDSIYSFENMQKVAFNERQTSYVLQEEPAVDGEKYKVDPLVTFLDFILPRGMAPAENCKTQPIRTGVTVHRVQKSDSYQDGVCPNPGCYLKAEGKNSTCQPG